MVTSNIGNSISLLTDGNNNTYPVYTLAPEMQYVLDFGPDFRVSATSFAMQGRMNFVDRMAGSVAFGSNDGENWTRLTPDETEFIDGMSSITVDEKYQNSKFRFIKIEKINEYPDVLYGNITKLYEPSELRIYGTRHETNNKLESVSITSDQSLAGRVVFGDKVKLSIKAKEEIQNVKVKIQEQEVSVNTQDQINWTAEATMTKTLPTGKVTFAIDYQTKDGTNGETTYFTTDNSKLFLSDNSDVIENVTSLADLIDSTSASGRSAEETAKQVNYLFDNQPSTNSDFRLNGSGARSFITFDFKEGNQVTLSSVELLARQDRYYNRIKGAVIQGSNDNETWTTLTDAAESTLDWQMLAVTENKSFRYIRIYNPNTWYGNISEVRFHQKVIDKTAPEITVSGFEEENFSDALDILPVVSIEDSLSGVDNSKTQITLDGNPYHFGDTIELYKLPLGKHTLIVNGSDIAGNHTSETITFYTFASIEGLNQLVTRFVENDWIKNRGIANSLQEKLKKNNLKSFFNEVKAQKDKHVNSSAADYLLRDAEELLK